MYGKDPGPWGGLTPPCYCCVGSRVNPPQLKKVWCCCVDGGVNPPRALGSSCCCLGGLTPPS